MKSPAGPDVSLTSFIAEGRASNSVRRLPLASTIEMRPEFGVTFPLSETSKLPWFVSVVPRGARSPLIASLHWALAGAFASVMVRLNKASEKLSEVSLRNRLFMFPDPFFQGQSVLSKCLPLLSNAQVEQDWGQFLPRRRGGRLARRSSGWMLTRTEPANIFCDRRLASLQLKRDDDAEPHRYPNASPVERQRRA